MATEYGPDTDRREIPLESGAAALIGLGRLLCELEFASSRSPRGTDAADLRERVGRRQEEVVRFFRDRPRAGMRRFVLSKTAKQVDPRACRLVGFLAARAVMHGVDAVGIMEAARAVSLTGEPAEILESDAACLRPGRGIGSVQRDDHAVREAPGCRAGRRQDGHDADEGRLAREKGRCAVGSRRQVPLRRGSARRSPGRDAVRVLFGGVQAGRGGRRLVQGMTGCDATPGSARRGMRRSSLAGGV